MSIHNKGMSNDSELRDIFAALAMQTLIGGDATPKWVASQAYKYADAMLDARDEGERVKSK
jgi:hypothetical protein